MVVAEPGKPGKVSIFKSISENLEMSTENVEKRILFSIEPQCSFEPQYSINVIPIGRGHMFLKIASAVLVGSLKVLCVPTPRIAQHIYLFSSYF